MISSFPLLPPHVSWFVVLPDSDAARHTTAVVRPHAQQVVPHASGRPWLLGRWPDHDLAVARVGSSTVAVLGQHGTTATALAEARPATAPGDLDRLARRLSGSAHLLASLDGRVRVQGTVTGVRRVFHTSVAGVPVAADRADVLAALAGATLDTVQLALHLVGPLLLEPVARRPLWRGVHAVPTSHYLVLDGISTARTVHWWSPPPPETSLREGAGALGTALDEAVRLRTERARRLSTDLAGLDSTSLCCVAARHSQDVLACTAASPDPLDDDVHWAHRTVSALNGAAREGTVHHTVIPADRVPLAYHDLGSMDDPLDAPCTAAADRSRFLTTIRWVAEAGSDLHLAGFGGDELLAGFPAYLHDTLWRRPSVTLRDLRGFIAKHRWSWSASLRSLLDQRSYRGWLKHSADRLSAAAPDRRAPLLDWGMAMRIPPWATPETSDAVRQLIRDSAETALPLAPNRGQHVDLDAMHTGSRVVRQFVQFAGRHGVTLAAPFYDDRVVEAGLAIRPEERVTPWRYKPLIGEATRGLVPGGVLDRSTKAECSVKQVNGLRDNRAEVLRLLDGSRLAELGLVDLPALRALCERPLPQDVNGILLYQTVACELWLRSAAHTMTPAGKETSRC